MKLLEKDKNERYTIKDIVSHPWLEAVIDDVDENITPLTSLRNPITREDIKEEIKKCKFPELICININYLIYFCRKE